MENPERTRYPKRVAVGMPLKLWTELHEVALDEELKVSSWVRWAIREKLAQRKDIASK